MIVFTPTKTMKINPQHQGGTNVRFSTKSSELRNVLAGLTKAELATVLKIKNKTLDLTYDYYHSDYQELMAIDAYDGISYKQVEAYNYEYLMKNVLIISALYGPINGTTLIKPYRLDFLSKKIVSTNLYQYWADEIKTYLEENQVKTILNLASNEYIKAIKHLKLPLDIIDLHFTTKQNSTNMKKYRGMIFNYCIEHQVTDYNKLIGKQIGDFHIIEQKDNLLIIET